MSLAVLDISNQAAYCGNPLAIIEIGLTCWGTRKKVDLDADEAGQPTFQLPRNNPCLSHQSIVSCILALIPA